MLRTAAGAAGAIAVGGCTKRRRYDPGVVTLDFYNYATPEFLDIYTRKLIPRFEAEHPGIKIIHHTSMGDTGYDAKLLTLIAGNIPPDLIHVTQNNFPGWAARGVLLPIDELIEQDQSFRADDFYQRVYDGMNVNGQQLGLPSDFSTIIMFCNKKLFADANVELPQPGWTWDDYLRIARKLTRDTNRDGRMDIFGASNPNAYNRWPAWVWMNGGEVLNEDMTRCLMDTPEAIGGLQFYVDLSRRHGVAPTPAQTMGQEMDDLFGKQLCAMVANSRYPYKKYLVRTPLRFDWDLVEMPRHKRQATTFIWGGNCILKSTRHPKEAWEFLKFLSGPVGAELTLEGGNALPPFRKTAEEAVLHNPDPSWPKNDRLFLDAIDYGRSPPAPSRIADYMQAMSVLHDAFLGLRSVEDACRRFARDANRILGDLA